MRKAEMRSGSRGLFEFFRSQSRALTLKEHSGGDEPADSFPTTRVTLL